MQRSKTVDHCSKFENLAPEIVSNILSRLAIEWILRCKCVCKNWYALIKDDFFVKLQLSIVNNQPSTRVIFRPSKFKDKVTELYLLDVEDCKAKEIPACTLVDTHNCYGLMSVMSSLDGLICLDNFWNPNPVVIYNPLKRGDYIILPEIGATNVNQEWESLHITLGFDPLIKKYKVVRMMTFSFNEPMNRQGLCEVITLGGEETMWRRVGPPLLRPQLSHRGVFHRGSIYWIIDNGFDEELGDNQNVNRDYILEFDVTNEVFRTIGFPHLVRAPSYRRSNCEMNLQILDGECLALMQIDGGFLHTWRLVKQNADVVVEYSSIRIEPAYKGARVAEFFCPNGREDCLLLRTRRGSTRRKHKFLYYYPFASSTNKLDHFVKLAIFQDLLSVFLPFQPSLVSAKSAFQGLVN